MSPTTTPYLLAAPVTGLYAALSAFLFVALSWRVIRLRMRLKRPMGSAGPDELARSVRMHGNFAEYVPLALLLLLLLELARMPVAALHAYGCLLILGRLLHAFGLARSPERAGWRLTGMVITLHLLAGAAVGLLLVWAQA